jgi:hypothetical protein
LAQSSRRHELTQQPIGKRFGASYASFVGAREGDMQKGMVHCAASEVGFSPVYELFGALQISRNSQCGRERVLFDRISGCFSRSVVLANMAVFKQISNEAGVKALPCDPANASDQ